MKDMLLFCDSHTASKFCYTLNKDGVDARWVGARDLERRQLVQVANLRKAKALARKHVIDYEVA